MPIKRFAPYVFALVALLAASHSQASIIWGTDASGSLTGTRTSAPLGGIFATEDWSGGNFSISWDVQQSGSNWTYEYTVVVPRKEVSHAILEVTEDDDPFRILPGSSIVTTGDPQSYSGADPSNPGLPNPIYGVKFDFGGTTSVYTLVTDRAPVWGVFYAKDGKTGGNDVYAYTTALASADYKTSMTLTTGDFIVRPNGADDPNAPGVVPEPASVAVWATILGMTGVVVGRRRRQA